MSAWGRAKNMAGWWLAVWLGLGAVLGIGILVGEGAASAQLLPVQGRTWGPDQTVSVAALKVPAKAWEHFAKANAAVEANRREEFERESAKALAIEPKFAEVYLLRAHAKVMARQFDGAIEDVVEARRIEPEVSWAGVLLAQAYNGAHRFHDAVLALDTLHGWEADVWQAKYERTRAAIGLKDAEGSLRWSDATLAVAPDGYTEVHLLRANALVVAERWSGAVRELEAYLADDTKQTKRVQVVALLAYTRGMAAGVGEMNLTSR
jgi:predicted Zn-dependent protease